MSSYSSGTTISVAQTNFPAESLYHELLHAKLKLAGYVQYLTSVKVVEDNTPLVVAKALDNELQHHRMFPSFVAAGFDPARFYHDGDHNTYALVRAELKRMKPDKTSAADYFLKYLSIMAPGGAGGEGKRAQLDRFFRMTVSTDKLAKVDVAAQKLRAWGLAKTPSAGATIVEIIAGLGDYDGWWFGASPGDFPSAGYFTGSPFTMDEAEQFAGHG